MKVLIIKTSSLGDIIQAFPVLQYLKKNYPQAYIDWVVEKPFMDIIQAHPYINQVYDVQTKKWRRNLLKIENRLEIKKFCQQLRTQCYDIVVDLQGNIKSGLITALAKSPIKVGFGYSTAPEWLNIIFTNHRYNPPSGRNVREDYLFLVQSLMGDFRQADSNIQLTLSSEEKQKLDSVLSHFTLKQKAKPKIMICPGSMWPNKQLSTKTFQEFLKNIYHQLQPVFLFVWGSSEEKLFVEELAQLFPEDSLVINKLSLPTLQNLMASVQLVIAMDSLPLHLAGTTATPTYSIFGASSSQKYKPHGKHHDAFQGKCPYNKEFEKRCPLLRTCSTGNCIKGIDVAHLFHHFMNWWESLDTRLSEHLKR